MAEYIERLGWMVSDTGSKQIIKMVDYAAMRAAFDEKFKETMQLIQNGETHLDNLAEGFHEADGVIFRMPAADVAPVVHGKWVQSGQCNHKPYRIRNTDRWTTYKCSECGYSNGRRRNSNYCSNCGAKMDMKVEGE